MTNSTASKLSRAFARKSLSFTLAAATMIGAFAAATPASAKWGRNAALFGGLAAGALVAGAVASNAYGAPVYAPACWRERRPVFNRWGDVVGYRSIRVCE